MSIDVAIPKLRQGSYFPDWLLEGCRRAEQALTTVVANCYLLSVSTRRMNQRVQALGITGLSKSQVSEMGKDLDQHVAEFRTRQPDAGPCAFVAADAGDAGPRGRPDGEGRGLVATGVNG